MPQPRQLLTKSGYLSGLQCDKLLWIYQNDRSRIPEPGEAQQAIFDQGHKVGELARTLFPGGIEIDWSEGREAGVARSHALLAERKPLFEAGFVHEGTHARADILKPATRGHWDLIEVKSSTRIDEIHLADIAFQRRLYEDAGVPISRCFLMHIDNTYVRRGDLEPRRLFATEDVTGQARELEADTASGVRRMLEVASRRTCPDVGVGPHCTAPYVCGLYDICWSFLPERNIFSLIRGRDKPYRLMEEGVLELKSVPHDFKLTGTQEMQVGCERTGKPHVRPERLQAFLKRLKYPLYFLDFETFNAAIPLYDRLRPYEQVPFQYSLHVVERPGHRGRHESFLADGSTDPRPEILSRLKTKLGRAGSIIAYNAGFEIRALESCAGHFSEFAQWFKSIRPRFIDLLEPFRVFDYYHPDQQGSASLKAVLPVLTKRSYEGFRIADGATASARFLDMAFGNLAEAEKEAIRVDLETYCHQDTEGMLDIVQSIARIPADRSSESVSPQA
jgi:hypothetical protein